MPKINTKYCGLHINFATYMRQEVVFKKLRTFSLAIDDAILSPPAGSYRVNDQLVINCTTAARHV